MSTIIIQHDDCLRHNPGPKHPESALRIKAVMAGLEGIKGLEVLPAPRVHAEQIFRVHPEEFWAGITAREPLEGIVGIDPDTWLSNGSIDAALRASGAMCFAIDQILGDKALRAFCAVRPPGHHSEPGSAMGFCLLNHVAIGAMHALEHASVRRVAIVDFDVHHGNGTQAVFAENPNVMYVSSHQSPLYPGTGQREETGCGNILNLPLAPGDGSKSFRHAWSQLGLTAIHSFEPDLILISAGFDAHHRDPLAQIELQDADYYWITDQLCDLATDSCNGRLASILEGGYDLQALASASRAHLQALAS
ncbi:MAG: histone deacetylase family protein [Lysobacterales bacterium]